MASLHAKKFLLYVLVIVFGAALFFTLGSWLPCGDGWLACAE
ncbi:MAG TPA: hypothetical protein VH701_14645 [Vicinamibacterales bacterium]|jgi:hypothetical protein